MWKLPVYQKESGNKGILKEKETVWRLQISVLIDTNLWIDWDFCKSILQIFPSLDKKPVQGVWLIDAPSPGQCYSSAAAGFAFCKLEGFVNELCGFLLPKERVRCQNVSFQWNIRLWPRSQQKRQRSSQLLNHRNKSSEETIESEESGVTRYKAQTIGCLEDW